MNLALKKKEPKVQFSVPQKNKISFKNNASPIKTLLGGVDWVPIADLTKCKTTIIRVNDVIKTSIDGANEMTVINNNICTVPAKVPSSLLVSMDNPSE